jgi:hypothetical protein
MEPLSLQLNEAMYLVLAIAGAFFLAVVLSWRGIQLPLFSAIRSLRSLAVVVVFLILLLIWGSVSPVTVPRWLGEIGIIALFFALSLCVLSYLIHGPGGRWALGILVAVAVACMYFDINDNHTIRVVSSIAPVSPGLAPDFKEWLRSRGDRERYSERSYPVYIVAAEGGGIYAAYHAAVVLARLQDQCPNFAQHVFAISSVSGGSLGAATFAGLTEKMAQNGPAQGCAPVTQGPFERLTDRLLAEDHLSPTIWGLLFPDFLQRFLPIPLRSLDRARWLEASFERSWRRIAQSRYFEQPLMRSYSPSAATPALLMNTTEVSSGQRIVITGFPLDGVLEMDGVQTINSLLDPNKSDLLVSTAAGLSARFPWLSPAGSVPGTTRKLVDGGYFENSGVETALDLIRSLKAIAGEAHERVAVRLIVMESATDDTPWRGFSEALAPVHTMLNARGTRGTVARVRAWRELCPRCTAIMVSGDAIFPRTVRGATPAAEPVIWHVLDGLSDPLPLGWHLGAASQNKIRAQTGEMDKCMVGTGLTAYNGCALTQIADEIVHGAADP